MEGDGTLVNGIGGNFSDVANSFPEPQEKCLQVQSSADDDDEEKEGQNVLDGQIRALHSRYLVIEALHRQCLDLQRMPASSPGINGKIYRLQQTLIRHKSLLDDEKARPETYRMLAHLKMFMPKNTEVVNLLKKEGDDTLVNGISGNFSDVANSFPEPPAKKCLQVQSSADDDEVKCLQVQIKELRRQCSDLHRMLASSPGINGKIYRLQQTLIRQSLEEEKAWAEIDRMLEDVKMSKRKNTEAVNFSKEDMRPCNTSLSFWHQLDKMHQFCFFQNFNPQGLNIHERTPVDKAVSRGKIEIVDAINPAVIQAELRELVFTNPWISL